MNKLKLTNLQEEILRLFYIKCGIKMNQNQISKYLNVSAVAVMKALPYLVEIGFINQSQEVDSKRLIIELNRDNKQVLQFKRVDNLKQLYETAFVDFLKNEFVGSTIILFGSYSKGEDTYTSDIDIVVIGRKEKKIKFENYEKMFEKKININFYDSFKVVHKNLKENIFAGIVLSGSIDLD